MGTNIIVLMILFFHFKLVDLKEHEGRIVGGEFATIINYPHSAFLSVSCLTASHSASWMCGGSIVNQVIILSAGHCVEECSPSSQILINVGDRNKFKGRQYLMQQFKLHENYDGDQIINDICIIKLQHSIVMGNSVSRVSLLQHTPLNEFGSLAGWGLIDEDRGTETKYLKHITNLKVFSRRKCLDILEDVPKGTICAGRIDAKDYAAQGDSGSALVIRNYIQIGLVSHKIPDLSNSIAIYTEIAYFHDWISYNMMKLYCKVKLV